MAAFATLFNWVTTPGNVWTRIAQGPLVTGLPIEFLELGGLGGPTALGFTLDGYSAAPPFYQRYKVTRTMIPAFPGPDQGTGSPTLVTSFLVSPWAEFWLLPTANCMAHIHMI